MNEKNKSMMENDHIQQSYLAPTKTFLSRTNACTFPLSGRSRPWSSCGSVCTKAPKAFGAWNTTQKLSCLPVDCAAYMLDLTSSASCKFCHELTFSLTPKITMKHICLWKQCPSRFRREKCIRRLEGEGGGGGGYGMVCPMDGGIFLFSKKNLKGSFTFFWFLFHGKNETQ